MILRYTKNTFNGKNENRELGILLYDIDNAYPFHTLTIAQNCSILKTCSNIFGKFIYGGGFSGEIWKKKVGNIRVDKLFRLLIDDYKLHRGFAVWVGYNSFFEKIELKHVPFENCRLKEPDDFGNINKILYSPNWFARKNNINPVEYDVFTNDKEITVSQCLAGGGIEKWTGQILYYGAGGGLEYPLNTFHQVIEDCITSIQCKLGRNSLSATNFTASGALEVPFLFETNEKGISREKNEFLTMLETFQGYDNSGNLMLLENPERDINGQTRNIKFHNFGMQNHDVAREKIEQATDKAVMQNYLIPEMFVQAVATGFSTEIMESYYNYYNQLTSEERQIFEELAFDLLTDFFGELDFTIQPLKYITYYD